MQSIERNNIFIRPLTDLKKLGFVLFLFSFLIGGCASQSTKTIKNDSAQYVDGLQDVSLADLKFKSQKCYSSDEKKNWKLLVSIANRCVEESNWSMTKQLAGSLSQNFPISPWGPFYLSLAAEAEDNLPKALWLVELSLKKTPKVSLLQQQKARILWLMGERKEAEKNWPKISKHLAIPSTREIAHEKKNTKSLPSHKEKK